MTDLTLIRRSLSARLFSTSTTVVMVAIAVALMLTLLAMKDSGQRAFSRGSGNAHLLVSRDSSPLASVLNSVFYTAAPARAIAWDEYEAITQRFPLAYAVPTQVGDSYKGLPVIATTRGFFESFSADASYNPGDPAPAWGIAEGRLFETDFEIVVGARAAASTGLRVGDIINVWHGFRDAHPHDEYDYRVVGILEPTGSSHDRALFSNLVSSWTLHAHDRRLAEDPSVALTTPADIVEQDRMVTGIFLRVATRPGSSASAVIQQVATQLRSNPTLVVASPSDEVRKLFEIVSNIDQILIAMAAVVMVSSAVSIMLALYNSMEQRRRQIAVLRVLGASRGRIFGLVVTESAVIGLVGAALGVALAFLGVQLVAEVLKAQVGLVIDPALAARPALAIALAATVLAAIAGMVPAAVAYRTSVARHLRPAA